MPSFSNKSTERLNTCDYRLQKLFNAVIQITDCTILEGYRPPERQLQLFNEGKSKVKVGKHNASPSMAVDVAPWPIPEDWDKRPFDHFAGVARAVAHEMGISIRWGGDWDGDWNLFDQKFNDLVHFEIRG